MRRFRQLPPFLRVVNILGIVCALSSLAVLVTMMVNWLGWHIHGPEPAFEYRFATEQCFMLFGLNLGVLGNVSNAVIGAYARRFAPVPPTPLPLDSLHDQVRAVLLLSLAPLCAIALALVIPPESDWFGIVYGVSLLGAVGALASAIKLGVPQYQFNSYT